MMSGVVRRFRRGRVRPAQRGLTLAELLLSMLVLALVATALIGAYIGQTSLNEHGRNVVLAMQDVTSVMEQIRQQNAPCAGANPSVLPPAAVPLFPTWDAWLAAGAGGGGKSLRPTAETLERIVITCQDNNTPPNYCNSANGQVTINDQWWVGGGGPFDPIRVTVAACWRHRGRIMGECQIGGGGALVPNDAPPVGDGSGVIDLPRDSTLTTLVTCQ
jgi:prepilin-type N-terminal cleavage/methylation domain-containing protein